MCMKLTNLEKIPVSIVYHQKCCPSFGDHFAI
jgi:hypothetical protein